MWGHGGSRSPGSAGQPRRTALGTFRRCRCWTAPPRGPAPEGPAPGPRHPPARYRPLSPPHPWQMSPRPAWAGTAPAGQCHSPRQVPPFQPVSPPQAGVTPSGRYRLPGLVSTPPRTGAPPIPPLPAGASPRDHCPPQSRCHLPGSVSPSPDGRASPSRCSPPRAGASPRSRCPSPPQAGVTPRASSARSLPVASGVCPRWANTAHPGPAEQVPRDQLESHSCSDPGLPVWGQYHLCRVWCHLSPQQRCCQPPVSPAPLGTKVGLPRRGVAPLNLLQMHPPRQRVWIVPGGLLLSSTSPLPLASRAVKPSAAPWPPPPSTGATGHRRAQGHFGTQHCCQKAPPKVFKTFPDPL